MVTLTKIYTRSGDKGRTSLVDGKRVAKHSLRVAAYGAIDETNAVIGIARLQVADPGVSAMLQRIQNDLFDLGADLATPPLPETGPDQPKFEPLRIIQAQVDRLEGEIDRLNADLAPLDSFVLPGGTPAAAHLHLARTVARRAERDATALAAREVVSEPALRYLNRLSDLLFVMARWVNDRGAADVLWVPGQNR